MHAKQVRQGVIIVALLMVTLWLGSLIWGLAGKAQVAIEQANQTKARYAELEERKAALERDLDMLATPRGHDAAIRQAFGVAKEGEEVIVVVPGTPATSTPEKSWWEEWFGWF